MGFKSHLKKLLKGLPKGFKRPFYGPFKGLWLNGLLRVWKQKKRALGMDQFCFWGVLKILVSRANLMYPIQNGIRPEIAAITVCF
jgi:hypothetical protein